MYLEIFKEFIVNSVRSSGEEIELTSGSDDGYDTVSGSEMEEDEEDEEMDELMRSHRYHHSDTEEEEEVGFTYICLEYMN